jgi:hypothetical protein
MKGRDLVGNLGAVEQMWPECVEWIYTAQGRAPRRDLRNVLSVSGNANRLQCGLQTYASGRIQTTFTGSVPPHREHTASQLPT